MIRTISSLAVAALATATLAAIPAATVAQPLRSHSVTLITGDTVIVRGDQVQVRPGAGRADMRFSVRRLGGHVDVIPSDVAQLVAAGKLDPRLFDVAKLIEYGYDDARTSSIPLIVTYQGSSARTALPGSETLPAIDGAAVRVAKSGVRRLLADRGIAGIWLDGKGRLALNYGVPRIGAPVAWRSGYTGKGVTVGVIDSGVDARHPDLVGKVIAARDFTGTGVADQEGHGTHVASIIAGTGKASRGRYRGVAPSARLVSAKVCSVEGGCPESAVIKAMHWAAAGKRARVINMSLGYDNGPGQQPLEIAANRLTAQTGALFVGSMGNEGERQTPLPGGADAALGVGAVDRRDRLAEFSNFGPRPADAAVKPELTGPGVDVVAAQAAGTGGGEDGEVVGRHYLRLSGTSMSAPMVAGTAALLAQRYRGWKAPHLKAALVAAAKPIGGQTVLQQGAGRVWAAKAINQRVIAWPPTLAFGRIPYPHTDDKAVVRTLTYRNWGRSAVTLKLSAGVIGPRGRPAPAGSLRLSAATIRIPAGGTAAVRVISSTRHSGLDGLYWGRVIASATGTSVITPFALEKRPR